MAGPRKVRIFRDIKKSPNWYVEWRDAAGQRHCESCGAKRQAAKERAAEIEEQMRIQRADSGRHCSNVPRIDTGDEKNGRCSLELLGSVRLGDDEFPMRIRIELPAVLMTWMGKMRGKIDDSPVSPVAGVSG